VQRAVGALQAHARKNGRIAAGCSAVFLLELAGLLRGRRVTTAWWLAPILQQMNPECQVEAASMVCTDGQITTAGAAFAQKDLMLHILNDLCGTKLVDLLSRFLLVDAREAQSQYVVPEVLASGDELVAKLVERIEERLPEVPSISELAAEFLISERTLARHVNRATGKSPTALLQTIRLRKARTLLEQSRMSVEDIAAAVGYSDSTALRRLMRKTTGNSPRHYRR
jgi:transcriptional regulator GlxA family with amidase domain